MDSDKATPEQLKEFWNHNVHPITGYKASVYRNSGNYINRNEKKTNK